MDKRKITQASPTPDGEDRARKRRKQSVSLSLVLVAVGCRWFGGGFLARWGKEERERDMREIEALLKRLAWLWYP